MTPFLSKLQVKFAGGCELLFHRQTIPLDGVVPVGTTAAQLITILKTQYIAERPELFVDAKGDGLRPGILLLVNGCDIEVVGGVSYVLEDGDEVDFISTLHGG